MANKRIKDLSTTAAVTASDDFIAVDGATNGTRKLDAYSPTFGGNLTVSGGKVLISYPSASQARVSFGGAHFDANSSYASYIRGYSSGSATAALDFYTTYGSSVLALSLSEQGNATLAGNLTVSGTGTSSFASGSKLGVGTTSPGVTFVAVGAPATLNYTIGSTSLADIRSTSAAATNAGPSLTFSGYYQTSVNTSTYGAIKGILQGAGDGNSAAGALTFLTANGAGSLSEWARLTNSGNLLIGTTTDTGEKLQVNGTGYFAGALIQLGNATVDALYRVSASNGKSSDFGDDTTGGFVRANNSQSLRFITAGNIVLTLDSSANATFAGKITAAGAIVTTGSAANMLEVTSSSTNATNFNLINSSTGASTWSIGSAGSAAGTGDAAGTLYFYQGSGTKFSLEKTTGNATFAGTIKPQQAATASAPTYVKGVIYFDTTLNKLRVGGATGWETITSV